MFVLLGSCLCCSAAEFLHLSKLKVVASLILGMQRGLVELYAMCHTKMEDLVPSGASVRYCIVTLYELQVVWLSISSKKLYGCCNVL